MAEFIPHESWELDEDQGIYVTAMLYGFVGMSTISTCMSVVIIVFGLLVANELQGPEEYETFFQAQGKSLNWSFALFLFAVALLALYLELYIILIECLYERERETVQVNIFV
uniref:Uncharacterized protein n=1 Tax=Chromera velia CCMP2878 TaxID=1169474 RepID=A0A0G4HUY5_9ALVE|eukprot:Cvel_8722.t1-p1 / transcript=Cvel_8722.t1 / gene=Cvel_8722 / organism=Chromera_velia_CCMP2878 / gene_product=hypothetical protein / transcript_product=hypothetical protein / location=Cvel_scaffold487:57121-58560(-) / protein_length=111 / sequence_SO=supercontig / SO=protein_coding / is_pseudo=false